MSAAPASSKDPAPASASPKIPKPPAGRGGGAEGGPSEKPPPREGRLFEGPFAVARRAHVVRLTGVRLADYKPPEDVFDERQLADAGLPLAADDEPPLTLDRIPPQFTTLADWPARTNLRCWACLFGFDHRPVFVPSSLRLAPEGAPVMGVEGVMCGFGCAERWVEDRLAGAGNLQQRWQHQERLLELYWLFTGRRAVAIEPAPRFTRRAEFGGDLTDRAFLALVAAAEARTAASCGPASP